MEVAMRFSSRSTVLLLAVISLLLPNGAFSNNSTYFPQDFANQPCALPDGKQGVCVYGYLCTDSIINIDGNGIIDLRFSDVCEDYFLKCCSKETPCMENTGKCVSASNCRANLNDPKYEQYKKNDECDWSDYKCCPNGEIGQASKQDEIPSTGSSDVQINSIEQYESCDDNAVCVPDDLCLVNPDGVNIMESRTSICNGANQTCCSKDKVKENKDEIRSTGSSVIQTNSGEQYESCDDNAVCVPDDLCLVNPDGVNILQSRTSVCSGASQTCCPKEKVKSNDEDPCNESGGTCVPESKCAASLSSLMDLRISQCDERGYVCCMQDGWDQSINQTCSEGKGKCTPKKQCRGTRYKDTNKECGQGLACCATLPATTSGTSVSTSNTQKPEDNVNEGKAGFNNRGKCSSENCLVTYNDKKNCGGLKCCGIEMPVEPDTEPPVDADRSCNSVGGKCMSEENCVGKTDESVDDCDNEVCCVQEEFRGTTGTDELIKDCGYRNEDGVNFNTTSRYAGESQFGEFPWMVAIMVEEKGKVKFTCGGSLIDPEVVLTSAECVKSYRRTPDKLIVRAGEWDMGTTREPIRHQELRVVKMKAHPGFKATTLVNNIALLFLDDKFELGKTINTVCLPPQDFVINNGEVTASGWGSTPQDRTKYQQILKSIDLQFIERPDCERVLRKGTKNRSFKLHRSFMCAGGLSGIDTCTGDAGSPVVYLIPNDPEYRYYAVGMVAWGVGCGRAGMPAAYTDVAFFRDWIDNEMHLEGLHDSYYTYNNQDDAEAGDK